MLVVNFLFGLGIFLYGMSELEKGIRQLSDVRLKALIRSGTNSRLSSVALGVITTAFLQSSSMVSLLVLAFASAGLLPLVNAIGVLLGANLGTTATGWIVATLGFKLNLEELAVPLVGSSAFLLVLLKEKTRLHAIASLFLGLGLLLFGLALMKTSMETLPSQWDVANITGQAPWVYLLLGVAIAFVIQSSSAVMMMGLAALGSNLIGLTEAAALVIGADLGTTSTTILGSLQGSIIKRKLAFAHVVFNLIVDVGAIFVLLPMLPQLLSMLAISDPLYGLVAFHSTINVVGLLLFLPILGWYEKIIERVFAKSSLQSQDILERVPANIADAALVALHKKALSMTLEAICNALRLFELHPEKHSGISHLAETSGIELANQSFREGYENLKFNENLVSQYITKIQLQPLSEIQAKELQAYAKIIRQLIYGNKTLKDIAHDLDEFKRSENPELVNFYNRQRDYQQLSYNRLIELLQGKQTLTYQLEELHELERQNIEHCADMNALVYNNTGLSRVKTTSLSMQLNVNHEIQYAFTNTVQSLQAILSRPEWNQHTAALVAQGNV